VLDILERRIVARRHRLARNVEAEHGLDVRMQRVAGVRHLQPHLVLHPSPIVKDGKRCVHVDQSALEASSS
jgi:hypothetical protein